MPQYLFVVAAKPFPENQNVKFECFHYVLQIFHFLPVVYIILNGIFTHSHECALITLSKIVIIIPDLYKVI